MESGVEIQNCWFHEKKSNGAVYYLYKITIGSVMKKLISKLQKIELELSKEYGELRLFAFFLPKESPNRWDLLVSAEWADDDRYSGLSLVSKKLKEHLDVEELIMKSKIVMLNEDYPILDVVLDACEVKHGFADVPPYLFSEYDIERAFFITSQRDKKELNSKVSI